MKISNASPVVVFFMDRFSSCGGSDEFDAGEEATQYA